MKISLGRLSFAVLFLLFLSACAGGGSQGTGGMQLRGTLYGESSTAKLRALMPLSGITVTIGESGESAVTDERGFYSIETEWRGPDVELFFDAQGFGTKYIFRNVPANASIVTLDFNVNRSANKVELINASIETNGGGTVDSDGSTSSAAASSASGGDSGDGGTGSGSSSAGSRPGGSSQGSDKATICHNPDSKNPVTMTVSRDALPAHLAHGDTVGPCPGDA